MQHVAIAEDRTAGIQQIVNCLKSSGQFTIDFVASNGYELIAKLHSASKLPDVVITDINMSVMDGIACNFYISRLYRQLKILSLSIHCDYTYIHQVIDSGAHGYLVKAGAENEILSALEAILSGNRYIDRRSDVNRRDWERMCSSAVQSITSMEFDLTPRESAFVMLNATPLSYEQIAKLMFVEKRTIHTYYDRVAQKLNVNSRQALTLFSIQKGLAKVARFL